MYRRKTRRGLAFIELLVVLAIIAILASLLLPAVQKIREASLLLKSQNNMKQICLGLHHLSETHNGVIPGSVWSQAPYQGDTFVELLPYVEQGGLYTQLTHFSSRPPGFDEFLKPVRAFMNPLDPSMTVPNPQAIEYYGAGFNVSRLSVSSYALNAQFFAYYPEMASIQDGFSQTIWISEHYGWNCNQTTFLYVVSASSNWTPWQTSTFAHGGNARGRPAPGDYYPITTGDPPQSNSESGQTFQVRPSVANCDPRLPNASSVRGLQVALADGSVRLLSPSINPEIFWGMVTPNGGEVSIP